MGIVELLLIENTDLADTFSFIVQNSPDGYEFTDFLNLQIKMTDYELTVLPVLLPFTITYKTCRPLDFKIDAV